MGAFSDPTNYWLNQVRTLKVLVPSFIVHNASYETSLAQNSEHEWTIQNSNGPGLVNSDKSAQISCSP